MPNSMPLLRAGVIESIILTARRMGIPTQRYIVGAGLPELPWGEVNPHQAVSLIASMTFPELVATREGLPLFGIQFVNNQSLDRIRSLHLQYRNRANLYQVLLQFIRQARFQSSIADYRLIEDEDRIWLVHQGTIPRKNCLQTDLFTVGVMIQAVRLVTGPGWLPTLVHLRGEPSKAVLDSEELGPCQICFNQPYRAIAFPRMLLGREIPRPPEDAGSPSGDRDPLPDDTISSQLEALLPAYLSMPGFNHAWLERITWMGFRTLQRRLRDEGQSYSDILARVRMRQARTLLLESHEELSDIASQLGYSNTPNFIRAFRSWTGITPGEYRLHQAAS